MTGERKLKLFITFAVIAAILHGSSANRHNDQNRPIIDYGGLIGNKSTDSSSTRRLDHGFDIENSNAHRGDRPRPGPQSIPGTNLKTRTFYKLGMKRLPHGYVTWTPQKNYGKDYRYIQIDNNREHSHTYSGNGDLFKDAQWEFVPVSSDQRYRWYKLRNRGRPKEYATWSASEFLAGNEHSSYLILDSKYPGRRSKRDFLFKPVHVQGYRGEGRDEKEYYQLKLRENRDAVIAWSDKEYASECYYIQVDSDERRRKRYEKGSDRFDDTLFTIELAEKEDVDDDEDIEDNNDDKIENDD